MSICFRISDIKVGKRHRNDLGDIDGLADSIAAIGLLHPIVVRRNGLLIAGQRRYEACKLLGWNDVPVTIVDLDDVARGELDENAIRKDFLPSEIEAIRRTFEPVEKVAAKKRMSDGGKGAKVSQPSRAADKIGTFAGVSGRTVEKIKAVVEAADPELEGSDKLVEEREGAEKDNRVNKQLQIKRRGEVYAGGVEAGGRGEDLNKFVAGGKGFPVI